MENNFNDYLEYLYVTGQLDDTLSQNEEDELEEETDESKEKRR